MKRKLFSVLAAFAVTPLLFSQTLFTYGDNKADVKEFARAYNKVYPGPVANKEQSVREYLELFINSKLKIQEAYMRRYDTLPSFLEEVASIRGQVMENFMTDPESLNQLVNEAFERSQKEIRVSHIFIPYKTTVSFTDSAIAKLKINEAQMDLSSGKSFEATALKYSGDPAVGENKGDLGYITAFSLPYEFENIVYSLGAGKVSAPYRSSFGYHIFKVVSERKAMGKIKAAQILLAIPPGSDDVAKRKIALLADSLYQRLIKGGDFANLAAAFSNDYVTAASGGQMQEFGPGTYSAVFENAAFSLPANGAISKPFLTAHGYHIVKRISLTPPPSAKTKKALEEMRAQVEKDPRMNVAKELLYNRIVAVSGFKQANIDPAALQAFADSILDAKPMSQKTNLSFETIFFILGDQVKTVGELIIFAQGRRWLPDGSGIKPFPVLVDEFKQLAAFDYYRLHMEKFNPEFSIQMTELKEGNLFFDIMMREVWAKAQADTLGQKTYYERNKKNYTWKKSADAVVFYCADETTARQLQGELIKNKSGWRTTAENFGDRSTADSGRFENAKIPGLKKLIPKQGLITAIEKNKDDNSASFALILKLYNLPAQKSYTEAKGDVTTDYQNVLDRNWIAELKTKYPVKINEEVLRMILK